MSFAAEVARGLDEGRRLALELMVDTCVFRLPSTETVFDEETLEETPVPGEIVYDGPCKVQVRNQQESNPDVAGAVWTVQRTEIHVPVETSTDITVGCTGTLTTATYDPDLLTQVRVVAIPRKSYATARRLQCEES